MFVYRLATHSLFLLLLTFGLIACSSRVTKVEVVNEPLTEELYEVSGSSVADVLTSIRARMTGGFAGWAGVNIYYEYEASPSIFSDCRVARIKVTTRTYMKIPNWRSSGSFEASMLPNWLRFIGALRTHEEGHIEIGLAAASSFASRFSYPDKVSASNCTELDQKIRQIYNSEMSAADDENRRYDKLTGHGKTQGTDFSWN